MSIKKQTSFLCAALVTAVSAAASTPAATPWMTDPTDAIMQAAADNGDALIWFSREDDAAAPASVAGGSGHARCRLQYPERSFERPDEAQWFIAWANRFSVEQIPSVVLLDGQGRPYARIPGAPDAAAIDAATNARFVRDAAIVAADGSTGVKRAQHLHAALKAVGPYAVLDYRAWAEEVVALDPDNVAGLRNAYAPKLAEKVIDEVIQGDVYPLIDAGAYADARARLKDLQAAVPGLSAEQHQTLTAFRAQLLITEGQATDAKTLFEEALALAPTSDAAEQIRGALAQTQ